MIPHQPQPSCESCNESRFDGGTCIQNANALHTIYLFHPQELACLSIHPVAACDQVLKYKRETLWVANNPLQ
jgi:hypothetical protein